MLPKYKIEHPDILVVHKNEPDLAVQSEMGQVVIEYKYYCLCRDYGIN